MQLDDLGESIFTITWDEWNLVPRLNQQDKELQATSGVILLVLQSSRWIGGAN